MAHWLIKSEPFKWSWQAQIDAGAKGTHWDGVRNHLAKLNMMKMKIGEEAFFYHSNEGLEIVGIVEVIREAYPDPTAAPGEPWVWVDFAAKRSLKRPVSLKEVKANPALAKMALVTCMRLSVQPVLDTEWDAILALSEV